MLLKDVCIFANGKTLEQFVDDCLILKTALKYAKIVAMQNCVSS